MAEQTLQAVRQAEQRADDKEQQAQQRADELLAQANRDAADMLEQARREASERAANAVGDSRRQGDLLLKSAREEACRDEETLSQQAQGRKAQAVKKVIDCLLS